MVQDIDLDAFVSGETKPVDSPKDFKMPEFEAQSTYYHVTYEDFGLKSYNLSPIVYPGYVDTIISQVAKIKVDYMGTEAVVVSEKVDLFAI